MDRVDVLVVHGSDTVEDALEQVHDADLRAVVVAHHRGALRLHLNRELLEATQRHVKLCADLRGGREVLALEEPATEAALDASVASFALTGVVARGVHTVSTRHEWLRDVIASSAKVCRCEPNKRHIIECPPGAEGQPCTGYDGTLKCY
jgi:hypothetical protein